MGRQSLRAGQPRLGGSFAELSVEAKPREDIDQDPQIIIEREYTSEDNGSGEGSINSVTGDADPVELREGVGYEIVAELETTFNGGSSCLKDVTSTTEFEADVESPCEQEIELDFKNIELVGCA